MGEMLDGPNTIPCARCGQPILCGFRLGASSCWCGNYPPLMSVPTDSAAGCYCEDCLRQALEKMSQAQPESSRGDG